MRSIERFLLREVKRLRRELAESRDEQEEASRLLDRALGWL